MGLGQSIGEMHVIFNNFNNFNKSVNKNQLVTLYSPDRMAAQAKSGDP
jgi:hypothetical protein